MWTLPAGARDADVEPVEFTTEQRMALRDAREADLRDTLGIAEGEALPRRRDLTDAQRERVSGGRADDLREILVSKPTPRSRVEGISAKTSAR